MVKLVRTPQDAMAIGVPIWVAKDVVVYEDTIAALEWIDSLDDDDDVLIAQYVDKGQM